MSLVSIILEDRVNTIGFYAFAGCANLTIYTCESSAPADWSECFNSSNRPVIWGCSVSYSGQYIFSFNKTATNPTNTGTVINNPYTESGMCFDGWYTTSDFSGTKYRDVTTAPNGMLYGKIIPHVHVYEYTYTETGHAYGCEECGDVLVENAAHSYLYVSLGLNVGHKCTCRTCGYSCNEEHTWLYLQNQSIFKCGKCLLISSRIPAIIGPG